jgi:hypothetical protein
VFWWVVFGTLLGPGTTTTIRLGGGVVPGFPHTTESLTISTLVFVGGGVCGGVVV